MSSKIIIFSKNRACQLDLLLRSLTTPATILYTHDKAYAKGYKKLINLHHDFDFIKQTDFKKNLITFLKSCDYVLFLTDDDVMIKTFSWSCPEVKEFTKNKDVLSLSLGLPSNIAGKIWTWKNYRGNYRLRMWGYPMSVDSCIFRTIDILPIIEKNKITTPNYLETFLNLEIPNRPLMMCFNKPKIINNSVNQVQSEFPAHTNGPSPKELEENFLKGVKLSLADIKVKAKKAKSYRIKELYKYELG